MARRRGWVASHPLAGTCPLCDEPLGGGNQRTNPLVKWRRQWAHRRCVELRIGE